MQSTFLLEPYQSLSMPEPRKEGKSQDDQNKDLIVSVKDGYDWSAYAEQFTTDLTANLALVVEIEYDEDWFETGDVNIVDKAEDKDDYDWRDKAAPPPEA